MIPWEELDSAAVPGGHEPLRLKRRGGEFSIMLGSNELMNSRLSGSEEALATLSSARLVGRPRPTILIGGLGMGFTLRAALAALGPDARLVVAELVPAVVAWARGPMAELFAGSLDDPRVEIREADVADLIAAGSGVYDAILLDVDNGPDGLSRSANDRLYTRQDWRPPASRSSPQACSPSGQRIPTGRSARGSRRSGFRVEEVATRARGKRGARHTIWLATRT